MSLLINAISQYNAILGLNNANFLSMQNNQNMTSRMNNISPNFGKAQMDSFVKSDTNFAISQAQNNFKAQAYRVELDSLEKAKKKQFESFNYFA